MNKLFKVGMVAALVMTGSSALAASGDAVTGGAGNVDITGTITSSTCAVSVSGQNQAFSLTADAIKNAKTNDVLATADATFTVNNCKDTALTVKMVGNKQFDASTYYNDFDQASGLRYQLSTMNAGTGLWVKKDGSASPAGKLIFQNNGIEGFNYKADSDSSSFDVHTEVTRTYQALPSTLPSQINATYAYSFIYL